MQAIFRIHTHARAALCFTVFAFAIVTTTSVVTRGQVMAPELEPNLGWLNTDRPLRLSKELKGHVVLLDFWTYCCINCMHVLPDLEYLEQKYADEPFVVIGVHSAKFTNESTRQSIRNAIFRYGVTHPVVIDDNFGVWNRYGARGWPFFVLIGADGKITGAASGEGLRESLDEAVRSALDTGRRKKLLAETKVTWKKDAAFTSATGLAFPGKVLAQAPQEKTPGRLFISDSSNNRVIIATWPDAQGRSRVTRIVGDGQRGLLDGKAPDARFFDPQGLALDAVADTLYIADTKNHAVRAVSLSSGVVETIVGDGEQSGDRHGGNAGRKQGLNSPWALAISPDRQTLYIAMAGPHQLWTVDLKTRIAKRLAGSGVENIVDGDARSAALAQPSGLALSSDAATLYFADSEVSAVRQLNLNNRKVTTIIGAGLFEFGDIDGPRSIARLQHPLGVALLPLSGGDRLLVADTYNHKIKLVDPALGASTAWLGAGRGEAMSPGELRLDEPGGLSVATPFGADHAWLFIADTNNNRIVQVNTADRSWREVALTGLRPKGGADDNTLAGAIESKIIAATGQSLSLSLSVELPDGMHVNPEAPVSIIVRNTGGADQPIIAQRTLRSDHFPVRIDAPGDAISPGARLSVQLYFASCDQSQRLCIPQDQMWIVTIQEGDSTAAALTAPAP